EAHAREPQIAVRSPSMLSARDFAHDVERKLPLLRIAGDLNNWLVQPYRQVLLKSVPTLGRCSRDGERVRGCERQKFNGAVKIVRCMGSDNSIMIYVER